MRDYADTPVGIQADLRVSKVRPRMVPVPYGSRPSIWPVRAWTVWKEAADLTDPDGPAWRRLHSRWHTVIDGGLQPESIGYGLPAQERDCRRWNVGAGHRIVHVVADGDEKGGRTGKSTIDEREGLMEAMEWIADGILAPNLDRLARELTVQEAVLAYTWALGGRVFTADHGEHLEDDEDDPMRTAMRQMRGVFHQLDRGLIRKRLRDGRATKGEQGGYAYGAPRFGQQAIDGELVDVDTEKEIEDLILTWHDKEGLGARA